MDNHLYGLDLFGDAVVPAVRGALASAFLFPPFSVLSARDGDWIERKRAWLALGIQSELGRDRDGTGKWWPQGRGRTFNARIEEYRVPDRDDPAQTAVGTTSVFDPVVCELAYTWFTRRGATVLDPFAGGSVRGIVAAVLGRHYTGVELSARQVAANREQAREICGDDDSNNPRPVYLVGDSACVVPHLRDAGAQVDFVFSCPPYGDLEVYSDDPLDLSTLPHDEFLSVYRAIIFASVAALRPHRFAAFMVGDYRGPDGFYRGFVGDTVAAFEAAGARLYNEAVYVTAVGSLPVRINGQWNASRKLGKTHQNLLVFCKGNPKEATKWING